ncbi:glycosyltransferase [Pectobacterium brasiliense]|uniref:glycosyltransferase n=1 Tax=Pectobacterium brasiliense TaxID=180957 RepID=UPI00068D76C2|nr:glycosyltransferase [Pectobacterium brasiliense]
MKSILIIATAATEGGALTILCQLLSAVSRTEHKYTAIINERIIDTLPYYDNINYVCINTKGWVNRILFDFYRLDKFIKKEDIFFDSCINMQNIPVRVKKIKQFVYLHQSIPFSDLYFSPFDSKERLLWLYKIFYIFFIKSNLSFADYFVVQTQWIKNELISKLNVESDNVLVIKPSLPEMPEMPEMPESEGVKNIIFYPATAFSYKNHEVLVNALGIIGKDFLEKNDVKLILTINKNELSDSVSSLVDKYRLSDFVIFLGRIDRNKVSELYSRARIMAFPSRLETFGLPLLEAAYYGLDILASDLPYSKEVLSEYNKVSYCDPMDAKIWADKIKQKISCDEKKTAKIIKYTDGWDDLMHVIDRV